MCLKAPQSHKTLNVEPANRSLGLASCGLVLVSDDVKGGKTLNVEPANRSLGLAPPCLTIDYVTKERELLKLLTESLYEKYFMFITFI